jgi:hypothetical protein
MVKSTKFAKLATNLPQRSKACSFAMRPCCHRAIYLEARRPRALLAHLVTNS